VRKSKKDRQCHGHTKLYIEQFDDTNWVIIGRKSKTYRQCHGHTKLYIEQFDDTNGVIIGHKSKKDRQRHGQEKGEKELFLLYYSVTVTLSVLL
jgi:metallophosphoesterase superfamily enzyme